MKATILLRFFSLAAGMTLFYIRISAQNNSENYVPNPTFSNYSQCPTTVSQFYCNPWLRPTCGSSDFYHECNNYVLFGISDPSILPHSGKGFIGLFTYVDPSLQATTYDEYREYAQVPLNLLGGKTYTITAHFSLAPFSSYATPIGMNISSIQNIDYYPFTCEFHLPLSYTSPSSVINNIGSWTSRSFTFPAPSTGTYYLTIGNFGDNPSTTSSMVNATGGDPASLMSYYLVSDVSVIGPGCCPDFQLYESTNDLPDLTFVEHYIKAGNDVGIQNTAGNVTVKTGQNVTFKAGDYIELLPGFSTEYGATFTAEIENCNAFTKPSGGPIDIIAATSFANPCADTYYYINVIGATDYSIVVYDILGQLVASGSGYITTNIFSVWYIANVSDAIYSITLTLSNCDQSITNTYNVLIASSGCKKAPGTDNGTTEQSANNVGEPQNSLDISNSPIIKTEPLASPASSSNYSITITPNPTTGRTVIYFSPGQTTTAPARLEITDVPGRTVFVKSNFAPGIANSIDLTHLQKGIYFLKISTEDEMRIVKVILQ